MFCLSLFRCEVLDKDVFYVDVQHMRRGMFMLTVIHMKKYLILIG